MIGRFTTRTSLICELSEFEAVHQVGRVAFRAKRVIEQRPSPHGLSVEALTPETKLFAVKLHPAGEFIGKAIEQRHQAAAVRADEVDRLRRHVGPHAKDSQHPEHDRHVARRRAAGVWLPGTRRRTTRRRGPRRGSSCGRSGVVWAGGATDHVRRQHRDANQRVCPSPNATLPPRRPPGPSAASSTRSSTTVMLSRPPASFAAAISASPASRRRGWASRIPARCSSETIVVRPSLHSRYTSPSRAR